MRWVKRFLIFLAVVIAGLGVYGFLTVRSSYPQLNGTLEVEILDAEVEVVRDEFGIPHIYANSTADLFRAQGFVEAQDRFYQMDFWRHIGSATLSEMFGESQVDTDMFLRALDFEGIAETELAVMKDSSLRILEWYSEGVNAYLSTHDGSELSLEYAILPLQSPGYVPESWTPPNTLTWAKVMSWDLSGNFEDEIARAVLAETLTANQVEQLFPPFPADHPVIVPSEIRTEGPPLAATGVPHGALKVLVEADDFRRKVNQVTGGGFEGIGSNNWVVSGDLTQSGFPLLANDPHLAIQMPSIWYEVGLHCTPVTDQCPFDVVGFGFPGTPGVVIGHNADIAWGVTTEAADTQDLYIEKINPDNPGQYEVDGEWVELETRAETIDVVDGSSVSYDVQVTKHGPIISGLHGGADRLRDAQSEGGFAVAIAWQTLQPSTLIESILQINLASNWEEFRAAASLWDIAAQNLVYADTAGNIGYQSTGEIPLRQNSDGLRPVPGWDSANDWVGVVPFEEMPFVLNPERGYLSTANQPVLTEGELPYIGRDGAYGYRASRIENMINRAGGHTVRSMQAMQMDARNGGAEAIAPQLVLVPTRNPAVLEVQNLIEQWSMGIDGFQSEFDSAGAAAYEATWRHLLSRTFHDDLPEDYWPEGGSRWFEVMSDMMDNPDDPFWDDSSTPTVESSFEIMEKAMLEAYAELSELLGGTTEDWQWGGIHTAVFENQTLGQSGIAPVEWLFNRAAPEQLSGGPSIVNAIGWNAVEGYEVDWVPSMRMVIDLGDLSNSTSIHTTGQSGHAFHGNYADMIGMWTRGEQHPMLWSRAEVEAGAANTLRLTPVQSG